MKDYTKSIKFFSNKDEVWQFIWDLDKSKYEVVDYGTLANFKAYFALYRKKDNHIFDAALYNDGGANDTPIWVVDDEGDWHCSNCKAIVEADEQCRHNWFYCYHCGKKMYNPYCAK